MFMQASSRSVLGLSLLSIVSALNAAPIHDAAGRGDAKEVDRLIEEGADVNAKTSYGDTPLHYAAGSTVSACTDRNRPNDVSGLTVGHRKVAEHLLEAGASPDVRNSEGTTPLQNAAQCNDVDIANLLIARGANVNNRGHQYSVLDMAVYWGPEVAKLLIERGAEVNTVTPFSGGTPLYMAVARGKLEVAQLLLDHGADVNARHKGYLDWTALHTAAQSCDMESVEVLLAYGADPGAKDENGRTPEQMLERCH